MPDPTEPEPEPPTGGKTDGAPPDPVGPGMMGAISLHMQFEFYVEAGFSPWQALYLCGQIVAAGVARG